MAEALDLELSVRDYECDLQGVVNNAVYQNYLEHARHEFLLHHGIDFAALAREGLNLMVARAELDYKGSLRSRDIFLIRTRCQRESRLKFLFLQDIIRKTDDKVVLSAIITGVAVNAQGRPVVPDVLETILTHE